MESDFTTNKLTFGFIGLGLMGGSLAKAFRNTYKDCTIIAYNRSAAPREMALKEGIINIATDVVDNVFNICDFIFLCTPVEFNESYLSLLSTIINENCILTDVGSVKGNIHIAVKDAGLEKNFIGGHPMAGSEKAGYEYSDASICIDAIYPITPTAFTEKNKLNRYVNLIESIGFKAIVMDYDKHDYSTAAISHLPHLIAAELVELVRENDDENKTMKLLAASGFKDTTRIAASSPEVWQQICMTNSKNISKLLDMYIKKLSTLKDKLDNNDSEYIYELFTESKKYRENL